MVGCVTISTGSPAGERGPHRGRVLRLHADHAHGAALLGGARLDRGRDAGDEPAAADPEHHGVDVGHVLEQLEAERRLPGHDVAVVERRDQHGAGALGELGGQAERRGDGLALEHDVGAVPARRQQLRHRHAHRHEDRRVDPQRLRGERHALRVVAGRRRDHAAAALLGGELGEPVHGAADLERPGALQVLHLQHHRRSQHLAERDRRQRGRPHDHAVQAVRGLLDLREGRDRLVRHRVLLLRARGTVCQM